MGTARLVLVAAVALAGCTAGPAATPVIIYVTPAPVTPSISAVPTPATPTATPTAEPTPRPTATPLRGVSEACLAEIGEFREVLDDLDARLDVGLTYSQYNERMGDVNVASNRMDVDDLPDEIVCYEVAILLNEAFIEYIDAGTKWTDCFDRLRCTNEDVEPALQAHWATASEKLDEAEELIEQ